MSEQTLVTQIFNEFLEKLSQQPDYDPAVIAALREKLEKKDFKNLKDALLKEADLE